MSSTSASTPAAMTSNKSFLTPTQRYGSGALFAFALHQAQIHQTRPLGLFTDDDAHSASSDRASSSSSADSVNDDPSLWVNDKSGLLPPVFRFLEIDHAAWSGLQETAASSLASNHVGAFLRLLAEAGGDGADVSENADQQLALSRAVDAMARSMEQDSESSKYKRKKQVEYEQDCREKLSAPEVKQQTEGGGVAAEGSDAETPAEVKEIIAKAEGVSLGDQREIRGDMVSVKETVDKSKSDIDDQPAAEARMLSIERKITVLYEILSACLADKREDDKKSTRRRKGYDARHRLALRLLATWLDVKWIQMEAIETMVASSAMALLKIEEEKQETVSPQSKWAKWKRGGIVGAAAVTGGVLLTITGGLAAPAIAAGLGALAPTLGAVIPVIGATGFAAAATAAGSVAGSVVVAASFGAAGAGLTGVKMARRTGSVDEFEFKAIGDNHNQGRLAVEILLSGFVFDVEDFVMPWEGQNGNLERYAVIWESKNLIAVSTAIQDWLTSSIALGLAKQGAMLTVLSSLIVALAWPATLLAATDFIDSKWSIAVDRSDKAGRLLADVLLKGTHGNRPVTLVGFSLGARTIFKCLQCLAETEHDAELVERVVLLGAPISITDENWEAARKMVAGRFVNAYSTKDWMLGIAFRASLLSRGLAGIQPIDVQGIENVDVSDVIDAHSTYLWATQQILSKLELESYYPVFNSTICIQK